MQPDDVKKLIEAGLPGVEAVVTGDGSHFEALVIGEVFEAKSLVEQQQLVYGTLGEHITSGDIHALTIKTYTPESWESARKLRVS